MIYVFKTTVETAGDIQKLRPHLAEKLKEAKWNFDLEDCDNILRIESEHKVTSIVIQLLHDIGFGCEELL
jgi:hypothetical protein